MNAYRKLCSTPFGITEVGTGSHRGPPMESEACSTPFGITEVGTSAWQRERRYKRMGAQRLSASQRSAHFSPFEELRVFRVLNAFRHHRGRHNAIPPPAIGFRVGCSTPFGITEVGTGRIGLDRIENIGCSTPFGITEVGTAEGSLLR